MRLLVCGGAGFIGSNFVRQRVNDHGDHVVVLDKLTYAGRPESLQDLGDAATLVHGAIEDPEKVAEAIGDGVDAIVNFAAETHVDRSISGPEAFVETNVRGSLVLLEAARERGVARYVQISTDEVYGSIAEGSFTEESPIVPSSPYSASKAGGDLLVQSYFHTYGLETVICRGSNNYGPYQYPEKVIPLFVTNLIDGHTVPLYGDGLNVRDWLHVDDHCRALHLVLRNGKPGEIYNIGGGTELSNRELTTRLLELCGAGWDRVVPVEDRKAHDRRYSVNAGKLADELGFTPRVSFEEGLAGVVEWYRDHRSWWEPLKQPRAQAA